MRGPEHGPEATSRRAGGESGVAAVTCLEGDSVWDAARQGLWSRELADAAFARIERKAAGDMAARCPHPALFCIEYRDGLRASVFDGVTAELFVSRPRHSTAYTRSGTPRLYFQVGAGF